MELVLLVIGMLVVSAGGLWYLGVAFQVSLAWGLGLLFFPIVTFFVQLSVVTGGTNPMVAHGFGILNLLLGLVFLFRYWDEAKGPFFTQLFGIALVMGAGFLGGARFLSSPKFEQLAGLADVDGRRAIGAVQSEPGTAGLNPDELRMFDQILKDYDEAKGKGMELDPRYEQAVKEYRTMRGEAVPGGGEGDGRTVILHGGSQSRSREPDPLIAAGGSTPSVSDKQFEASSRRLLAASQAAKRDQVVPGQAASPWHADYLREAAEAKAAWKRVNGAIVDPARGKDLGPACKELFQETKDLPRDLFAGAPDDAVRLHLSQTYDTLRQVGTDCMAGRLSAMQVKLRDADELMGRASKAMAVYGMTP